MMADPNRKRAKLVADAMLKMVKLDFQRCNRFMRKRL
jgi:hypothetical protein